MAEVTLDTSAIVDWPSFHEISRITFGFPDFYGRNLNAWIDCLTYPDDDGMTRFQRPVGEVLRIVVPEFAELEGRLPEIAHALVECVAAVNRRSREMADPPALELVLR